MTTSLCIFRELKNMRIALAIIIVVFMTLPTNAALAEGGDKDKNRSEFSGIVQSRPDNGNHGQWVIGGRTVLTTSSTQFDEAEGPLKAGSCAKVKIRNGRIHEIDSEPMTDCQ